LVPKWTSSRIQPTTGGERYYANNEASGVIELIPLLAAIYDDEIGALLIDEPEISLHPQLQAFLLHEMETFAGDPIDASKKLIVFATHSATMLPLRSIKDIPRLVFFTDRENTPVQIASDAGELNNAKLNALIARLSENHKLAFFARSVLLVEGPSDEIVVGGLALALKHPLLASNTQVVPVTGKGQFGETVKLFRLMAKNVFVLADLDGLADDNQLVNVFHDKAEHAANACGMGSVAEIDRGIRDRFNALLDAAFDALSNVTLNHRHWTGRGKGPEEELKAKRRATLAALFLTSEEDLKQPLAGELLTLRKRYEALMDVLASAGCVILRRGAIEDYYFDEQPDSAIGKPEAAATEMEGLTARTASDVRKQFNDVIRAVDIAAPLKKIDENEILREQLGSLLGAALQIVRPGMSDDELNSRVLANFSLTKPVFRFANRSEQSNGTPLRRVHVSISSPLFVRPNFPFEISEHDNITVVVDQKLASV
jgi:AAA domain, putative AbiEii toxin, Type IV TA system